MPSRGVATVRPLNWTPACYCILLICASYGQSHSDAATPVEAIKRYHEGRVIFDLLAALRASARPPALSRLGFSEFATSFQGDVKTLVLRGSNRTGLISQSVTAEILRSLASAGDFALLFTLRQSGATVGTLLAFTNGNGQRLLEVQSSWRREELRLHYLTSHSAASAIHVEKLPYRLADDRWHQVALGFSGGRVTLTVDCRKICDRLLLRPMREDIFRLRGTTLWLGQRGRWQSHFQGEMQDATLVIGEHGLLEQCPHMESSCPTCGQHATLARAVELLQAEMQMVKLQLKSAELKLHRLAQCDCVVRCAHNGTVHEDGQTWDTGGCQRCACRGGRITCGPRPCPPAACAHPVLLPDSCCPTCLRSCSHHGSPALEHGTNVTSLAEMAPDGTRLCVTCHCRDGSLECLELADHRTVCPAVDCPASRLRVNSLDCCPYCEGYDYCAKGHSCSPHADCVNLHNRYHCVCRRGYHGDGRLCVDTDECSPAAEAPHGCGNFSDCVNTEGGYECRCRPGFEPLTEFQCQDVDECAAGGAHLRRRCSPHADCANTRGGYECRCRPGYHGDGTNCEPDCQPACKNGGRCVRPGVCGCPTGFHGNRCEKDLDECSLGLHRCHKNSHCRNLPGSYHCVCSPGFTDAGRGNAFGSLCRDVNECLQGGGGRSRTCQRGSRCVNTLGAYRCLCKRGGGRCNRGCAYRLSGRRWLSIGDGASVRDPVDPCAVCACRAGFLNCTKLPCSDCSALRDTVDLKCCPACLANSSAPNCWDSVDNARHSVGSRWTRDCETCYCLGGEIQCHAIKCPTAECPNPTIRVGACCPICEAADPCRVAAATPVAGAWFARLSSTSSCSFNGRWMRHGSQWRLDGVACVLCQCKDGHVCCSHDDSCDQRLGDPQETQQAASRTMPRQTTALKSAQPQSASSRITQKPPGDDSPTSVP